MGERDFLIYWSASRLLATGGNPFDLNSLLIMEAETRPERMQEEGQALASWNPPWLLVLLLPLGLLPFDLATHVWIICNLCLIGAATALAWLLLSGTLDRRSTLMALVAGLYFGASLVTIYMGQISSLLLVGLLLSAYWLHTGRDKLAGVALFLTTIKPHITYFVLFIAVLWAIRHRRWQVFWGIVAALWVTTLVLWILFPDWVPAYLRLIRSHTFFQHSTSTLGSLAYALWGTNLLRFAGVLSLPLIPFLLRTADSQGWLTAMNLALLASVPLAPYGFTFDLVVLLPAIIQMVTWLWHKELTKWRAWAVGGGLVLVYLTFFLLLSIPNLYYHCFAWVPLAVAGLYTLAWTQRKPMPA
ncbi:MAG: DUF2029 domain-containing protein [Chloroflexi bacterium]|nr:DUF2029 domain-containing protein [Chloroflexota bacterium]